MSTKDLVSVEVIGKGTCLRYTAKAITDVKVAPSPKWLKERLEACGLRPINNVVDITNYAMLETGQPLHAFDGEKIGGRKIIVRFAKNGEKITTLDGENYNLDDDILVIADAEKPVAIAGIKGGKMPEIDNKTKIVILEAANFNSQIVRRGSRKLNLKTDASLRFEHGIDPNLTEIGILKATRLIQEIAKGKIARGLVDVYTNKVLPKNIVLNLDYLKSLLGVAIAKNKIKNILESLGFKIVRSKGYNLLVRVPTFRQDVSLAEDLIEEVGRIYGYDKIPAVFPVAFLVPPKRNLNIFWEDTVKNILKEAEFIEAYNYSFISEKDKNIFGNENLIELENPLSQDYKYLRPSLIPTLLKNIQKNQKSFSDIKIFELGKVFRKNKGKSEEKRMLTGVIFGGEFAQLKGVIDVLLNKLGISSIWYDDYQSTPEDTNLSIWHSKKCAEIKIDNQEIGFLGELSSKILGTFKISQKILVFDLDFEKLTKLASEEHEYRPIPKYPAAVRDVAVLIPRQVKTEEVLNIIETSGGVLVRDVDLFDIYEGENIPEGKKNLAFHIIYQAEDRTLSSKEIEEIHNKIIQALEQEPDWQVRK